MANSENQSGGVIVVGGISIDLVAFADKLPAPGESILGDDFKIILAAKAPTKQ
jgi:ribokinase